MSTGDYWFNLRTKQVERGQVSPVADRMGPYDTPAAAAAALQSAAERNEEVDEAEEEWRTWGEGDDAG
ncbi:hypothetical protein [Georgenia sp. Z1491]|uniref:hypothetical protein n=1 Tax=Georgenia sp. Z1491 TaxID=3416707 RepID=UPI003CF73149